MDYKLRGNKMKKFLITCVSVLLLTSTSQVFAEAKGGIITDITSVVSGLLIRIDTGVPTVCAAAGTDPTIPQWMEISEANRTMVSVALAAWASGNKQVTISADGSTGVSTYCRILQFDPLN